MSPSFLGWGEPPERHDCSFRGPHVGGLRLADPVVRAENPPSELVRIFHSLLLTGGVLTGVMAAASLRLRGDAIWIDAVTGSAKFQTTWLVISTAPRFEISALGRWVVDHEGGLTPDWCFVTRTHRNVFGEIVGRGCGHCPEISHLRSGDLDDAYVRAASDRLIGEFVRIMRQGSESERRQAIEAAYSRAIESRDQGIASGAGPPRRDSGGDRSAP